MLYNLATARGFKYFVRFLPHEAADMEPCVELLYFQNEDDADHWVAPMLALWLSIIVLVPFDIATIDSQQSSYEQLVKRIIKIGTGNLSSTGKLREFSASLLGKVLTRPDVIKQGLLDEVLKDLVEQFLACKGEAEVLRRDIKALGIL
jgi:tubulin-specific chaperone D